MKTAQRTKLENIIKRHFGTFTINADGNYEMNVKSHSGWDEPIASSNMWNELTSDATLYGCFQSSRFDSNGNVTLIINN